MTLNIKDAEADRVVRELAAATGESITVAVTRAAEERLERVQRRDPERVMREVQEIVDRVKQLPVLDDRPADEIIGYDEHGLPS